ncbi:MAG: hypothetical protein WDZ40_01080 [Candidatus Spechtbacterales bacterium]
MQEIKYKDLPKEIKKDADLAQETAEKHAYPRDKNTKVGAVIISGDDRFLGANVKRWSWSNGTCAERMALDKAFFDDIKSIDRVVVYSTSDKKQGDSITSPCGPCREMLWEAIGETEQGDVDIYMVNKAKSSATIAKLSELLPLAFEAEKNN